MGAIEDGTNRTRTLEFDNSRLRTRWRSIAARERIRYRTWKRCGREHVAPMEPFRVHLIDPRAVTHVCSPEQRLEWTHVLEDDRIQSVDGGDWDRETLPITDSPLYRALHNRFVDRLPWEKTGYVEVLERENRRRREAGLEPRYDIESDTERNVRYAYLDGLFETIAADGYAAVESSNARDSNSNDPRPPSKRAIPVAVGRGGELSLVGHRHRFTIARLLGLEAVPVHVLVRHEEWQARRDRLVRTGTGTNARDESDEIDWYGDGTHPDLEGLASDPLALDDSS